MQRPFTKRFRVSASDQWGNACSFIQSNYAGGAFSLSASACVDDLQPKDLGQEVTSIRAIV